MKYICESFKGRERIQGWIKRAGIVCVGAVCAMGPMTAQAGSITQGEFLGWLVAITGDSGSLGAGANVSDYVRWAQGKGLNPNGGWSANAALTRETLAQTLVQLFNLNPKKYGGKLELTLLREGIVLPTDSQISLASLVTVVDQIALVGKLAAVTSSTGSGTNGDNGHPGNIPSPGFRNPRNPHFGIPPDDIPGHNGLGPRNQGGTPGAR